MASMVPVGAPSSPAIEQKAPAPVSPILSERSVVDSVYEGQYDIGKELARGTFGVVHEATHALTGATVGIKEQQPTLPTLLKEKLRVSGGDQDLYRRGASRCASEEIG